jgi:hypothetical protein
LPLGKMAEMADKRSLVYHLRRMGVCPLWMARQVSSRRAVVCRLQRIAWHRRLTCVG